jgi:putative resolvase
LYARGSSHEKKADLDRQVARLPAWAAQAGLPVVRVKAEVGSGMNGTRARARRLLADPAASVVVVDDSEVTDDLVRDMIEVLTAFCARRDIGPQAALTAGSVPCGSAG